MTKYKLGDLCVSITDGEHGSVKDDSSSTFFLLNNNNITESGIVINSNDRRISKKDFDKIHRRTNLECGDLVIATCGTLGKTCIIRDSLINYEFSRSVGIIKCNQKKLLPEYLHYFFLNPLVQSRIAGNAKGGVQKHFYIGDMKDFEIQIPILADQKKIASVLSALDDKIALNKKMNQKLEAMAKRLYDYWFVQYDFPDKNGHPYKTTGGPMTYNSTLKREIPAGWEVSILANFAEYVKTSTKFDKAFNYVSTDNMLAEKQGLSGEILKPASGNVLCYEKNDILISNIRPYFKKIWYADQSGTCSTDVLCVRSLNLDNSYFVYRILWQDDFFDYVMQGAKGSKMPRGDKMRIMNYPICIAKENFEDLIKKFSALVVPMQAVIQKNTKEISRLTKLRDKLLPLLMNGQVTVG